MENRSSPLFLRKTEYVKMIPADASVSAGIFASAAEERSVKKSSFVQDLFVSAEKICYTISIG